MILNLSFSNGKIMISGKSFIGEDQSGLGTVFFKTFNPLLNHANDWEIIEATSDELQKATALSWTAFKTYRNTSDADRALFLETIANEIENLGDELLSVFHQESGLPISRAKLERERTVLQLRLFADFIKTDWMQGSHESGDDNRLPKPKPALLKTYLPLGPVAVFGASNFPLAYSTAGGDTASALAAGCPVIVKSHPMHAATGEMVASAIIKAAKKTGMPNGVFSNLNSSGFELGIDLVNDPHIKAVGFTGSITGGRAIFDIANQRAEPIPVFAEMGSLNPVVISPNSLKNNADNWASRYADSITQGTGQFCTNPGLILGLKSEGLGQFTKLLANKIEKIESAVMLHPKIENAFSELKKEAAKQRGVEVLTNDAKLAPSFANQTILTVSGEEFLTNPKLHREVFGPFSIVVAYENLEQITQIIESLEGQLTGTIILEDSEMKHFNTVIEELKYRVGRLVFNGVPTGVEVSAAMNHGGPYPASTDSRFTAVGVHSIKRWIRPICIQNMPK